MVYAGCNVGSLIDMSHPTEGSFRLLPDLKALAPRTADGRVAFMVQGYEVSQAGQWETHRYLIQDGQVTDQTDDIRGQGYQYPDHPPFQATGKAPATGTQVSLFDKSSVEDFVRSSLTHCARHTVFMLSSHGQPAPAFAGEALAHGQRVNFQYEELLVSDFSQALQQADPTHRIELLDLNCCQMGKAENALELAPVAPLILASQQDEAAPKDHATTDDFQDVPGACGALLDRPDMTPEAFGKTIISDTEAKTRYQDPQQGEEDPIPTLTLYRTAGLSSVIQGLSAAGDALNPMLDDPQKKAALIKAAESCFHYEDEVVDLQSFLAGAKVPLIDMAPAYVDGFRGQYMGTDYRQVSPFAAYLPHVPSQDQLHTNWWAMRSERQPGADVNALMASILSSSPPPHDRKKWLMDQGQALNKLFSNLYVQYPEMLSVCPDARLQASLQATTERPLMDLQMSVDHVMMDILTHHLPPDQIDTQVGTVHDQIQSLLKPWAEATKGVDFNAYLARFDTAGGPKKLADRMRASILTDARTEMAKPVAGYQGMASLPESWKTFQKRFADVLTDEVLPARVAQLT
jgi:hypothetical protein